MQKAKGVRNIFHPQVQTQRENKTFQVFPKKQQLSVVGILLLHRLGFYRNSSTTRQMISGPTWSTTWDGILLFSKWFHRDSVTLHWWVRTNTVIHGDYIFFCPLARAIVHKRTYDFIENPSKASVIPVGLYNYNLLSDIGTAVQDWTKLENHNRLATKHPGKKMMGGRSLCQTQGLKEGVIHRLNKTPKLSSLIRLASLRAANLSILQPTLQNGVATFSPLFRHS